MNISIGSSQSPTAALRMKELMAAARPSKADEKQLVDGQPPSEAAGGSSLRAEQGAASAWPRKPASSDGPRVEVDRRTEDSDAVRITVISYSDGSSESVTQMKTDQLVTRITDQIAEQTEDAARSPKAVTSLNDKGLLVDKWA